MALNLLRVTTLAIFLCLNISHLQAKPQDSCFKTNATECYFSGNYNCGTCECYSEYFGKNCECSVNPFSVDSDQQCTAPHSPVTCSGRGSCICNHCECEQRVNRNEKIYGRWCECDNFSCNRHGGKICADHGICDCGKCVCTASWTGPACECYSDTNTCNPPFKENPQVCDGHGDCVCGICQCHITSDGGFTGRYCEGCPHCIETCDDLTPCVLCQMYHVGPYDDETCVKKCTNFTPFEVEVLIADEENDEVLCITQEENCKYSFVYKRINVTQYAVKALNKPDCSH